MTLPLTDPFRVESCLTEWQGGLITGALGMKLQEESDFNCLHNGSHVDRQNFAGNSPHGTNVDIQLRRLLGDLAAASALPVKQRLLLRILFVTRNSTAHTVDSSLSIYQDRSLVMVLIQVVFVSVFAICQLKGRPMP